MDWITTAVDLDRIDQAGPAPGRALRPAPDLLQRPFRYVCSIVAQFPEQKILNLKHELYNRPFMGGTGIIISPRHILTCAHVVRAWSIFGKRGGRMTKILKPDLIYVTPGRVASKGNVPKSRIGTWRAVRSWVPSGALRYDREGDATEGVFRAHDFALIEVQTNDDRRYPGDTRLPGGGTLGWWCKPRENSIRVSTFDGGLSKRRVNVAGYPEREGGKNDRMRLGLNDVIDTFPPDRRTGRALPMVRYAVNTRRGMSGGPIWVYKPDGPYPRQLVALHHATETSGNRRYATGLLIRPALRAFLRARGVPSKVLRFS
ncbi:trypsin-like serine peptidase [Aestuariibius sp. 2305UL40-4]|uniref:trypsin-like serine peptidase n=1 Tax=Aestuariibius violaceus TaxID=3234132 RepID=UPI00345EA9BB